MLWIFFAPYQLLRGSNDACRHFICLSDRLLHRKNSQLLTHLQAHVRSGSGWVSFLSFGPSALDIKSLLLGDAALCRHGNRVHFVDSSSFWLQLRCSVSGRWGPDNGVSQRQWKYIRCCYGTFYGILDMDLSVRARTGKGWQFWARIKGGFIQIYINGGGTNYVGCCYSSVLQRGAQTDEDG